MRAKTPRRRSMWQRGFQSLAVGCLAALFLAGRAYGDDWPMAGHDASRSAVTAEPLSSPLKARWIYRCSQPPTPAWPEPGKELHRMDFDYAPQPVIAEGLVYFGSSADDTLRAVELVTGELKWRFTAGGPIRFAPSVAGGRVYLAADDGWVYCLDAGTGQPVWRFHAAPEDDRLIGNGRMISRWPCRSGVLVVDDLVYCTAGMWPNEGVYVYALDAGTGRVRWCNDRCGEVYLHTPHPGATAFSGVAPQGYLLVHGDTLLVPTGRCVPAAFDRRTGRLLYYNPAAALQNGGAWLTAAAGLYFNPKNHFQNPSQAFIGEAQPHGDDGMLAYAFTSGDPEFTLPGVYRLLATPDTLYTVTTESVQAVDLESLRERIHALTAAQNVLKKSTSSAATKLAAAVRETRWTTPHTGRVYVMAGAGKTLLLGQQDAIIGLDAARGTQIWSEKAPGQVRGLAVSGGRLVAATHRGELVCFAAGAAGNMAERKETPIPTDAKDEDFKSRAAQIVHQSGKTEGYATIVGEPDSRLAEALAGATQLQIISVLPKNGSLISERDRLLKTGIYGSRVAVLAVDDPAHLPFAPYFADLVIVAVPPEGNGVSPPECYRLLRPCGGAMYCVNFSDAQREAFVKAAGIPAAERLDARGVIVRGALPGAGEWRYPWADGGRSGVGQESRVRLPVRTLWFGGPGPDRLMDRHWMGSPPLACGGRVFMVGQQHVFAFDAYNGRELWSQPLKDAGRRYSQYYSENFVADGQSLYVVTHDECRRLEQATGRTTSVYHLPESVVRQTPSPVVQKYLKVAWPTVWQVLGPFSGTASPLAADDLRSIPKQVRVDGNVIAPKPVTAGGGLLNLKAFSTGFAAPIEKPIAAAQETQAATSKRNAVELRRAARLARKRGSNGAQTVYAFAGLQCPQAGKLLVQSGADGPMQWYLDGRRIFDSSQDQGQAPRVATRPYLFDVDVTPGEHVLAAAVEISGAWRLTSASLDRSPEKVMPVVTGDENVPNLKNLVWGYVSVTDDLLLGSYAVPIADGQPDESQLISRSESKALFALDKRDGSLRWIYRPRSDRTISNIEIAFGDGRLFLLDATSKAQSVAAQRYGRKIDVHLTLVALDLQHGRELWRQDDVPVLGDRSEPTRLKSNPSHLFMGLPKWGHLMYAKGTVVLGVNAAYDAATGKKLWQQDAQPQKLPIVLGDWLIGQPEAYDLRTGRQRMTRDFLTGEEIPWSFRRAYGCGPINGCQNVLFGRSGADGIIDMATRGTANFGGVRPACSRSITAACGLLIHPEGYSGCGCSYNYQTSLAMIAAPESSNGWYLLPRHSRSGPIRRMALNFGAPGDRCDAHGVAWLGFPRPISSEACPAPVTLAMENATCDYHRRATAAIKGEDPWIYSSALHGHGQIAIDMALQPHLVIPEIPHGKATPVIDGTLDEPCWKEAAAVPFEIGPLTLLAANAELRVLQDAQNLYFGYRRGRLPDARSVVDRQALGRSDAFEIWLTDRRRRFGLHFGLMRDKHSFAHYSTVNRNPKIDPNWKGDWQWAIQDAADQWSAEVAIPLALLKRSGIDIQNLELNSMSRNLTQSGLEGVFVVDPGHGMNFKACTRFVTVGEPARRPPPARTFTVRLHFAEIDDVEPGQRVFEVALQGRPVLTDFDIVREAGGKNRPLVREFHGIEANPRITIDLKAGAHNGARSYEPVLCGVEISEQ